MFQVTKMAEKIKKVIKLKVKKDPVDELTESLQNLEIETKVQPKVQPKKAIKIKKGLPVPPVNPCPMGQTAEAFEILREYHNERDESIPQDDLKWYYEAIEQDKKDEEQYWVANPTIKAMIDSIEQGLDDEQRLAAEQEAKKREPVKPQTDDLGPMPEYGSGEFWAWCRKRKAIRLAKEAAIIAAGGTVPPEKPKKPRAKKT